MLSRTFSCAFLVSLALGGEGHEGSQDEDEYLEPFLSVSLGGAGLTLESAEYNEASGKIFYASYIDSVVYGADYNENEIESGTFTLSATAFDDGNFTAPAAPTGMYADADGEYLYVNSGGYGTITAYDIASMTAMMQLTLEYDGAANGLNGMCNDPTDASILYVTAPGNDWTNGVSIDTAALYKVNLTDGTYMMVDDYVGDEHPNGCAVSPDGDYVYMVSIWVTGQGGFLKYDVSAGTTTNMGMDSYPCDGLVFDNDGRLFATQWGNTTTTGIVWEIMGFDGSDDVTVEQVATGLNNPADMSYDSGNNWLVIPQFDLTTYEGSIAFVDLDESDDDSAASHIMSTLFVSVGAVLVAWQLL